jgi:hypothetical protein
MATKVSHSATAILTRRRTFQKFFGQQQLREWIDQTLGVSSVAAGPGVQDPLLESVRRANETEEALT